MGVTTRPHNLRLKRYMRTRKHMTKTVTKPKVQMKAQTCFHHKIFCQTSDKQSTAQPQPQASNSQPQHPSRGKMHKHPPRNQTNTQTNQNLNPGTRQEPWNQRTPEPQEPQTATLFGSKDSALNKLNASISYPKV